MYVNTLGLIRDDRNGGGGGGPVYTAPIPASPSPAIVVPTPGTFSSAIMAAAGVVSQPAPAPTIRTITERATSVVVPNSSLPNSAPAPTRTIRREIIETRERARAVAPAINVPQPILTTTPTDPGIMQNAPAEMPTFIDTAQASFAEGDNAFGLGLLAVGAYIFYVSTQATKRKRRRRR